jgi:very-short-patch-repair endonuclease
MKMAFAPDITGSSPCASTTSTSPADARDLAFAIYACGPEAVAIYIDRIRQHIDPESAELFPFFAKSGAADLSAPFRKIYLRAHRHWLRALNRLSIPQSDKLRHADGRGDSPIEAVLFAAMIVEARFGELSFERVVTPNRGARAAEYFPGALTIESQVEVLDFRVDFLVSVVGAESGRSKHLVVECDGHQFHHATKQQISRDDARDRFLQKGGYSVFRYPGSDIWADPCRHASEVVEWAAVAIRDAEVVNGAN